MSRRTVGLAAACLIAGDIALVVFYVAYTQAGAFHWFVHGMFNLDGEANVPAWYTSAQLLLAAVPFLLTSLSSASAEAAPRWLLALGGAGLLFLSADEMVGFHEAVTALLRPVSFMPRFSGGHGMWVPVYLAVIALVALVTTRPCARVRRAEPRGSAILAAGALVFVTGAVGVEILSYGEVRADGPASRIYMLFVAVEEGLELLGASLMLIGSVVLNAALNPALRALSYDSQNHMPASGSQTGW
jgi:hypothetical protein